MFKRKKKIFSMILTLCMVATMFLGSVVAVHAAENVIESVTITGIPVVALGDSIAEAKATVDAPEGCIVTSQWYVWDAEDYWVPISSGTFTETDVYYLGVELKAAEGYVLSEDFEVKYADGIEEASEAYTCDEEDNIDTYYCDFQEISFATPIYKIDFEIPEVKAGNTAELENITFYSGDEIVANENFEINATWECTIHYEDVTGEVFEDGHAYYFSLEVTPKAGYYFADTIEAYCNGEADEAAFGTDPTCYDYYYSKSLLPPVERVEINGLPEGKAGETMSDTYEVVTVLEDFSEAGEISFYWWNEEGDDTAGEVMEEGQVYTLQIEVYMYGDYPLSEDFVYVIDGKEYEARSLTDIQAFIELEYDLRDNTEIGDDNTEDDEVDTPTEDDEVDVPTEDDKVDTPAEDDKDTTKAPVTGDYSYMTLLAAFAFMSIAAAIIVRKRVR